MPDYDFEKVEVPRGTFVGWAAKPGQKMTAKVVAYDETGGRDRAALYDLLGMRVIVSEREREPGEAEGAP